MKFSIIMPIYNVELYLKEAIESVLNQTYTNFELILINDGSTDNSLSIAEAYNELDERIKLINKSNEGLSAARNDGLEQATGEYVCFLDSDDWLLKNTLYDLAKILTSKTYDIVFYSAESFSSDTSSKMKEDLVLMDKMYEREYLEEKEYTSGDYYSIMASKNNFVTSACLYVFNKKLSTDNHISFVEGIIYEDNLFTRQLLLAAHKVYFIPTKFYQRRVRANSITTSTITESKPFSYLVIASELLQLSKKYHHIKFIEKEAIYFYKTAIYMIENNFITNKELVKRLLKVEKEFGLLEYKSKVFQIKYPYFSLPLRLIFKIRIKINSLIKLKN